MRKLVKTICVIIMLSFGLILVTVILGTASELRSNEIPLEIFLQDDEKLPLVINTWAFKEANEAAWNTLNKRPGSSALDALIEGCTMCERMQCDGTVGYGGSPDEQGDTKLDAMVMDGATMNIGAVAAMDGIKDAIHVARFVLERTHHTLLVGTSATDFAVMMGFPRTRLNTPQSKEMWKKWREEHCQPNFWTNVQPDPGKSCGPYKPLMMPTVYDGDRNRYLVDRWNHDTIGMIVISQAGQIYAGTSTNGASFKIPGRVGDSPIPGAGAYADNEVGAAVATGDGDIMMRFLPSLLAVEAMRSGTSAEEAAAMPLKRILRFYPKFQGALVAVDRFGNYGAACAGMEKFPFSVASGPATSGTRIETRDCLKLVKE